VVVVKDSTEVEEQTRKRGHTQEHKEGHHISAHRRGRWVLKNRTESRIAPCGEKADSESPENKRPDVAPWMGWRRYLCGIGLAGSTAEGARERARPLLIQKRDSHDLTSSTLIAAIRV
jgi:hypothetical protein